VWVDIIDVYQNELLFGGLAVVVGLFWFTFRRRRRR
jgi:LPXTG-motif cell wall-anchored protein